MRPSRPPARGLWGGAIALVQREPILLALLAFGAAFFAYRYSVDLQRPGQATPEGWWGFNDQRFYLTEAQHLGELGGIPADAFNYGPGYPFLAAPFAGIGTYGWPFDDPFLPVDAAVWLVTLAATYLVGRRLGGEAVGVGAALAVVLATPLILFMTIPWNTTAVLLAVDAAMLVALSRRLRWWHGAVLGLAVGLAYSSRYVDAAWVGIAALAVLAARGALRPRPAPAAWAALAGLVAGAGPALLLQWSAFGDPFETPYGHRSAITGREFDVGDIPSHFAQSFLSPFHFGDPPGERSVPLLAMMFLILLVPVGVWLALRGAGVARRWLTIGFAGASLVATLFYCAYFFTANNGIQFGSQHFFKAWFPLWALAGTLAVVEGVRRLAAIRAARA